MPHVALHQICSAYVILILLTAGLLSPMPHAALALLLLAMGTYATWRPPRAEVGLSLTLSTLVLMPLAVQPWAGSLSAAVLAIPALPLLDRSLRESSLSQPFMDANEGRAATGTLKSLGTTLFLLLASSALVASETLAFTTIILASYIIGTLGRVFYAIPRTPLEESKTQLRVVTGSIGKAVTAIRPRTKIGLRLALRPRYSWVRARPSELVLLGREASVTLTIEPPLAGSSKPELQASVSDPWGLIQTTQTLEPVALHVIPKAKHAAWLARKYLEMTAPGTASTALTTGTSKPRWWGGGGIEYYDSRSYQPGDRMKDVDWKHTLKLGQLIVKEYIDARRQPAVIAVNLAVGSPQEADWLAYTLVNSALTLATEFVPTALAAYDGERVVLTTAPLAPREVVKAALKLVDRIVLTQPAERLLHSPDIGRLRRSIG
ncbi:MAG: DUF58 domain-containing protein, partial [Chloroflexota bacterium]